MKKIVKKSLMVLAAVVCCSFSTKAGDVCSIEGGNIEASSCNLSGNTVTVNVLNDSPNMANVKVTVTVTYKYETGTATNTKDFSSGLTLVKSGGPYPIVVYVDATNGGNGFKPISAKVTSIFGAKCQQQ